MEHALSQNYSGNFGNLGEFINSCNWDHEDKFEQFYRCFDIWILINLGILTIGAIWIEYLKKDFQASLDFLIVTANTNATSMF